MLDCFQFCFNFAFNINLRCYTVARIVELAVAAGRRPVIPALNCSAPWIERHGQGSFLGVSDRHHVIVSAQCDADSAAGGGGGGSGSGGGGGSDGDGESAPGGGDSGDGSGDGSGVGGAGGDGGRGLHSSTFQLKLSRLCH
jgi:hypothetical protein